MKVLDNPLLNRFMKKLRNQSYIGQASYVTILCLCFMASACGIRPLTRIERSHIETHIPQQAQALIKAKVLPNQAPLTNLELIRVLFSSHPLLKERLPNPLTPGELMASGIRRPGQGQVGDLIIFRNLSRTLEYAVIIKVISPTRYQAIGILLGKVKQIEIDLAHPQARRNQTEIINTAIRPIKSFDQAPYLYLAGSLFSEFRSLF